jgi:hypothetical protein
MEQSPTPERKQAHPDLDIDRAWTTKRRTYVRAAYNSPLAEAIYKAGGRWDRDAGAYRVPAPKLGGLLPLIAESDQRKQAFEAIRDRGHHVHIPYDLTEIRQAAKRLGAVFFRTTDGQACWAMPDQASFDEVRRMLADHKQQQAAARAAEKAKREAQWAAEKQAQQQAAADRAQRAAAEQAAAARRRIQDAGRSLLSDEPVRTSGRLYGHGRRDWAESAKPQIGEVLKLADGRRIMVTECHAEFIRDEDGNSPAFMIGEDGWVYYAQGVLVSPTAEEAAADAAEAAEAAEAHQVHILFRDIKEAARGHWITDRSVMLPDGPRIHETYGITGQTGATVVLGQDGQITYQHPGWHDDYVRRSACWHDEQLAARLRAVFAGGSRRLPITDEPQIRELEVTVPGEQTQS